MKKTAKTGGLAVLNAPSTCGRLVLKGLSTGKGVVSIGLLVTHAAPLLGALSYTRLAVFVVHLYCSTFVLFV
jgi:hypothetical protein